MKTFPQFSLDLPKEWQDQTVYYFVGPEVKGVPHLLTVALDRKPAEKNLEAFARQRIEIQIEATGGAEILKDEAITLPSGKEAHEFVCRWIPSDDKVIFKKTVYLIHDGIGYTFAIDFSKQSLKIIGLEVARIIDSLTSFNN